jgi:hypothetical protein
MQVLSELSGHIDEFIPYAEHLGATMAKELPVIATRPQDEPTV